MDSDKKNLSVSDGKSFEITAFFEKDKDFLFVFKKTEKLVKAVYLITNLFPESESLKSVLRSRSTDLLSYVIGYKDAVGAQQSEFVSAVRARVLEIAAHLEIASAAGLVSPMNFEILKQEFYKLTVALEKSPERHEKSLDLLSSKFFEIDTSAMTDSVTEREIQRTHSFINSPVVVPAFTPHSSTPILKDKKHVFNGSAFKKNTRQEIILDLLKKNSNLTIKDIAAVIRDCSEKTIQRELMTLIEAKVIKKTGERRWSRYSLVSE